MSVIAINRYISTSCWCCTTARVASRPARTTTIPSWCNGTSSSTSQSQRPNAVGNNAAASAASETMWVKVLFKMSQMLPVQVDGAKCFYKRSYLPWCKKLQNIKGLFLFCKISLQYIQTSLALTYRTKALTGQTARRDMAVALLQVLQSGLDQMCSNSHFPLCRQKS